MFRTILSSVLYGGLTKEEFDSVRPDMDRQNLSSLKAYSTITTVLFGTAFLASIPLHTYSSFNFIIYAIGFVLSLLLLFCTKAAKERPYLVNVLKYLFAVIVYVCAVLLSTVHRDAPSVTFMVVLVMVPLLFSGMPVFMGCVNLAAMVGYTFCIFAVKDQEWILTDVWNTVFFGILGIIVGNLIMYVRLQEFLHLHKIDMLSESDLLTGLKNRNAYEQYLVQNESATVKGQGCVYADVNGLHEMNNLHGHKAGDAMLQTVAEEILRQFGRECSYRVGGDEFIVFTQSMTEESIGEKVSAIVGKCLEQGYYVSFGYSVCTDDEGSLAGLVKSAEEKMYAVKAEYYQKHGSDRRHR